MESISLCMIVKNEEKVIARCLESVIGLVNEIIVVDTGSMDETKNIAQQFGAKIYDFKWNNNFSNARNYALEQSTSSWNIVLDADEYIINDCKEELLKFINNEVAIGRIEIRSKFIQNNEVNYDKAFVSRVFPTGLTYNGRIHEQLVSKLPRKNIPIVVGHDGYYLTDKSNRNIPLLLQEVKSKPNDPYYLYQLAKEYRGNKNYDLANQWFEKSYALLNGNEIYYPSLVVIYLYTLKEVADLNLAIKIIKDNQTRLVQLPDFHFIRALLYMDLVLSDTNKYINLFPEIEKCYLKCIELGDSEHYDSVVGTGSFAALYNLGTFYEVTGQINKAKECYSRASEYNYKPAINRLDSL
ncbi:glycosyltransferase [Bacillus sp. JJ1566]|uniref:tetratricopeptide repeat-containing glycosyltransferase family 2 protein n=1 Tax=Bacillus sp. JJ1566 TaxID=3122961 RepID=UPI002FFEFD50